MAAYCPHTRQGYSVSLDEIAWILTDTRTWVDGFLVCNEPGLERLLGPEPEQGYPSTDMDRWRGRVTRFRLTGSWPWPDWFELHDLGSLSPDEPWPSEMWIERADQVCFWRKRRWARCVLVEDLDEDELALALHDHDGEAAAGLWPCCGRGRMSWLPAMSTIPGRLSTRCSRSVVGGLWWNGCHGSGGGRQRSRGDPGG